MSIPTAGLSSDNSPLPLLIGRRAFVSPPAVPEVSSLQSIAEETLPPEVTHYLSASLAASTWRAYQGDVADFQRWGGQVPSTPATLARYVAERAQCHRPATIARRVAGIGRAHALQGFGDPAKSELVRAVLQGVRRAHSGPQLRVAALMRDDLVALMPEIPNDLRGLRDRAVLLLGFASAMRRSELVALDVADLHFCIEGLLIRIRRSKTDQLAVGRTLAVAMGRTAACPVAAVKAWLDAASIDTGPVFRGVTKADSILGRRLSSQSVALIVKSRVASIGLPPAAFSGHSLRAGLVTTAVRMGLSAEIIQRQTGHKSVAMVERYVRDPLPFTGNDAGAVL